LALGELCAVGIDLGPGDRADPTIAPTRAQLGLAERDAARRADSAALLAQEGLERLLGGAAGQVAGGCAAALRPRLTDDARGVLAGDSVAGEPDRITPLTAPLSVYSGPGWIRTSARRIMSPLLYR
jgi:hypothetical protein